MVKADLPRRIEVRFQLTDQGLANLSTLDIKNEHGERINEELTRGEIIQLLPGE